MWKEFTQGYSISNQGQVRNDKTGRILRPDKNSKGYLRVCIKTKKYFIHRLVGIHFVDNPLNKPQINHIDYIKTNNHYTNLEWMTNQENGLHSYRNGRTSGRTKLSIEAL